MTGDRDAIPELESPSSEVGSEGGSPGDLELGRRGEVGTGSEAGRTWQPAARDVTEVKRDDTGIGRRSPND